MNTAKIKVRFYETDMAGIVHHSNHIRWFEMGRVEYLRQAGVCVNALTKAGIMTPIISVECVYKTAARFDDDLILETKLDKISRVRVSFSFRIIRECDSAIIAEGRTENAFADTKTYRVKRLPVDYYERLKEIKEKEGE